MNPVPTQTPDWHEASRELVNGFVALQEVDQRILLMDKLCERLGGNLYPAFLKMLCIIERDGDRQVRCCVSDTLTEALTSGRMPAGSIPAWGANRSMDVHGLATSRSLGPIEYLCAWYSQPSELPQLDKPAFTSLATHLLQLISTSDTARQLYCEQLMDETGELGAQGALARETRAGLKQLGSHWMDTNDTAQLISRYLDSLHEASDERLSHLSRNPFF